MPIRGVLFDAYGTLLRNESILQIPQRIVADHGLSVAVAAVWRDWIDRYVAAVQSSPFRTLRQIHGAILPRVLQAFDVAADAGPYVELFMQLTTRVEPYPETRTVLASLRHLRTGIVSNADHEHRAAWTLDLPVDFILVSEAVGAYKPDRRIFQVALDRLGLEPEEVLHVGDSDVDDVLGAQGAGLPVAWVNREGRALRPGTPRPDFEIRNLTELLRLLRA
jgi:2-haloalkanoic acid dehalogenase type II